MQKTGEWVQWEGGECPVDLGMLVEVTFRSNDCDTDIANLWYWHHDGGAEDIIAYRPII